MRGSAIVRGIDATGVSAFVARTGAACAEGVDVVVVEGGGGVVAAQAEIKTRERGKARRRIGLRTAKKTPPRFYPRRRRSIDGQRRYGRVRRITTRRLRRRPSAVVLSPTGSEVPRPSTVMRDGSMPWRVTR